MRGSWKEKEVLLAELHHRVKNNLAIISGLLNLQEEATSNEEAKRTMEDSVEFGMYVHDIDELPDK